MEREDKLPTNLPQSFQLLNSYAEMIYCYVVLRIELNHKYML
jgi:hypothetical protein